MSAYSCFSSCVCDPMLLGRAQVSGRLKGNDMARAPNYGQERKERDRQKAAKKAEKLAAKVAAKERSKPEEKANTEVETAE